MRNLPDDWGMYASRCPDCKEQTHASEAYECLCAEMTECPSCDKEVEHKELAQNYGICEDCAFDCDATLETLSGDFDCV